MNGNAKRSRWIKVSRRLVIALAFTFLLSLLGLFNGVGYHIRSMKEVSFTPDRSGAFAIASFNCDITYDPALFPFYWVVGAGRLSGNFSMMFFPEGYSPGEFGGPVWGLKPQDRFDAYGTKMVMWGSIANLVFLLFITLAVEAVGKRVLYLIIFGGMIGFAVASTIGGFVGLFSGTFAVAYITFKLPKDNVLKRFWESLWE